MITDDQQYQHETWDHKAECNNPVYDIETLWLADENHKNRASITRAKEICNTICPVRDQCLTYALENGEDQFIWGGLTVRERKRLNR